MDFKKLLENKILLASIVGGVVLLLIVFIICGTIAASNKSKNDEIDVSKEPLKEDVDLLTTDNLGKALEIQALLATEKSPSSVSPKVTFTKASFLLL